MSAADDKRAQIAGALGTMGYKNSVARDAASKLTDLDRPLPELLREGLRYAAGESPPAKVEPAKSIERDPMSRGQYVPSMSNESDLSDLRVMLRKFDREHPDQDSYASLLDVALKDPDRSKAIKDAVANGAELSDFRAMLRRGSGHRKEEKLREETVSAPRRREPDFRVSFGSSRSSSSKWTEAQKTYAALGVSGVVLAGLGAAFYFFVLRSDEAASPASSPSAPHPPAHPPAALGASLKVHTPHGQPGQLRAGPSKTAARTLEIPNGAPVHVLESTTAAGSTWYRIDAGQGRVGWMHGDILQGST
jgi:hypothetical protein